MRKRLSDPGRVDLRPGSVHHRHVTPRSADLVVGSLGLAADADFLDQASKQETSLEGRSPDDGKVDSPRCCGDDDRNA